MSESEILNRVAASGLITIDPADFFTPGERLVLDIKPWLFKELILKEKDFREYVKAMDWTRYDGKIVTVTCSSEAIIPVWAYMLIAVAIKPYAAKVLFGNPLQTENILFLEKLNKTDFSQFEGQRVILKGCGEILIPENVYVELTSRLLPYAKSILYGEACSNVPVYKKAVDR